MFAALGNVLQLQEQPDDIMVDFEIAAINAAAVNFPGVEMKGCFYHFCSNLWKRIQRAGFQERYQNDGEFTQKTR